MSLEFLLSWVVMLAALILFSMKCRAWRDTYQDWKLVKGLNPDSAVYKQALGFLQLSYVRVVDGVLWLGVASLVFLNRFAPATTLAGHPVWVGRGILLLLIAMEMVKLLIDRRTRQTVYDADV